MLKDYNFRKKVKIISTSLIFIFIFIYSFFISANLIFGVKIKNVMINDTLITSEFLNIKLTDNIIKITGNALNAVKLTLDDREIFIDKSGNFNENIAILPGYNIITLKAIDKFKHTDQKNYQLIYQAPEILTSQQKHDEEKR